MYHKDSDFVWDTIDRTGKVLRHFSSSFLQPDTQLTCRLGLSDSHNQPITTCLRDTPLFRPLFLSDSSEFFSLSWTFAYWWEQGWSDVREKGKTFPTCWRCHSFVGSYFNGQWIVSPRDSLLTEVRAVVIVYVIIPLGFSPIGYIGTLINFFPLKKTTKRTHE